MKMEKKVEKKYICSVLAAGLMLSLSALGSGCAPAVFGGAVAGAYLVESDKRPAGRMLDDSKITARVNLDMANDGAVNVMSVDVDTLEGVVILSGLVSSEWEVERASAVAWGVAGVKDVKNNLQIGSRSFKQAVNDKVLGATIKTSLFREQDLKSFNVDVDVYNGVVCLTGVVVEQAKKDKIIEIARTTSGTVRVIDNIIIREQK